MLKWIVQKRSFNIHGLAGLAITSLVLTSASAKAESAGPIYDTQLKYENPFAKANPACENCVQFYRVARPIMPMVNHIFIAAMTTQKCGAQVTSGRSIYGASKGASDGAFLNAEMLKSENARSMLSLGGACGERANSALKKAVAISQSWQKNLSNIIYLPVRYLVTPVLGRPCANAASEINEAAQEFIEATQSERASSTK